MTDTTTLTSAAKPRLARRIANFVDDQRGASFIEYIIVVGLVAIIAIAAFQTFGTKVVDKLTQETTALDTLQPAGH
ncbi:MAG TPA: Flp family type IVb pilin [Polyangiales bacterium]|jgi:pilus assembly protein Flp/PilA